MSYLDAFAVASALQIERLRRIYWAGWTGIAFTGPLMRFFSRLGQIVPVDPERDPLSSLAFGAAVLKRGNSLVWFPERGRSPDGKLRPFKPGVGVLARAHPVPIVPVLIRGTFEAWPVGRKFFRLHPVSVTFGEPVDSARLAQEGEGAEDHQRILDALQRRVAELAR